MPSQNEGPFAPPAISQTQLVTSDACLATELVGEAWGHRLWEGLGTPLIVGGWLLKFSTPRRSLPYTSSEKRSALAKSWGSMCVPARISITENARLGTTWHRADALVLNGDGFWKSVYERSRNGKECFEGSQS